MIISARHKYSTSDEFTWKYASYTKSPYPPHDGEVPCWTTFEEKAIVFKSVKEAKEWFDKNKNYLNTPYEIIDEKSLAVRKRRIIYKTIKNLTL